MADEAKRAGKALGIAVQGNASEVFPQILEMGWVPDVMTEMCPCHDPFCFIPLGFTPESAENLRRQDRRAYLEKSRRSMIDQLRAMNGFFD